MTTDEALDLIGEVRDRRRADVAARVALLVSAARIVNDDTAVGDPEMILNGGHGDKRSQGIASPSLTYRECMTWFATLVEAVGDVDRFAAWRTRTAAQHHHASEALDCCIATAVDRATLAAAVLLYGEPELEAVAA